MLPSESSEYQYGERKTPDMSKRAFRIGNGRIAAHLSSFLGVMSLLAVLAFLYPTFLTTADLRRVYDAEILRQVLRVSIWLALGFAVFTLFRNRRKILGIVGGIAALTAVALGGWQTEIGEIRETPISLGIDWMLLDFLICAPLFIFIEKMWPRYPGQVIRRPEWQLDLTYFCINHLLVDVLMFVGNSFAPMAFGWAVNDRVHVFVCSLPLFLQVFLLIVCADFVLYWVHRICHERPALWRFHAVHHSPEYMDWLAGSRNHVVQAIIDRSFAMVPLYLLGADSAALNIYVIFAAFQTVFVHANVEIPMGPLKYIFATPRFHHWHHGSDKPAIDTNYGVHTPWFDLIFGTYHMPERYWPVNYGTTFRLPRTFWDQFLYPFRRTWLSVLRRRRSKAEVDAASEKVVVSKEETPFRHM